MADSTATPNLRALEDTYRVVGELRASGSTRRFVAKRNDDGAAVMVTVVAPSADAQNNELSHYAADAKLLASLQHPSVLPVLDGRWLGDSFAIITERASGTTLQDELDRHAEFRNPRIAMILQDIWSGIEAAREQGVVHRWVTPDSVYFDPSSKRPVVALSPAPIPITGVPGPAADARTIGTLAWAMVTGAPFDPKSKAKLAELEPNLATRVVEAVEGMVRLRDGGPAPDVPTALGIIAAGDVLKQGEIEIQAMKEEYEELHRLELEKCESHRMETEQFAAEQASLIKDERALLDRLASEQSASLAAERAEFEKLMVAREGRIVELRQELEREAARVARGLRVEEAEAMVRERSSSPQPRSFAPTALASVLLGLILLGALVYGRSPRAPSAPGVVVGRSVVVPTMPSVDTTRLKPGGFMSQNAAGNVASPPSGPPLATRQDSARAARDSSAADSLAHQRRESTGETIPRHRPKPKDSANDVNGMIPPASSTDTLVPPPDTLAPRPDTVRRDTAPRPDTMFPRDTFMRRDTFPRRDSAIRRDTLIPPGPTVKVETTYVRGTVTRDTLGTRPDTIRRP
jgi:hypothetical protein